MTVVTLRPRPKVENPELLLQDLPRLSLDDATRDGLTDRLLRALEVSTGRVGIACRLSTQLMLRGESRAALPIIDQLVMQNPQSIDAHCELVDLDWGKRLRHEFPAAAFRSDPADRPQAVRRRPASAPGRA